MKKIFILILVLLLGCSILCGCAELISTEYETVQAEIIDEYYRGGYMVPMRVGKVTTMRHVPATYRITVRYEGVEYYFGGHDTWEQYKDMVGETVAATLEIRTYDDGTIKRDITALGEVES